MLRLLGLIAMSLCINFSTAQAKVSIGTIGDCTPAERQKYKKDFPEFKDLDCGFFCMRKDNVSQGCFMTPTTREALFQRGEINNILKNLSESDAAAYLETNRDAKSFSDLYKSAQSFGLRACNGAADSLLTARQSVMDAEKSLAKLNESFSCDKTDIKKNTAQ